MKSVEIEYQKQGLQNIESTFRLLIQIYKKCILKKITRDPEVKKII